jgi:hypothetical protein
MTNEERRLRERVEELEQRLRARDEQEQHEQQKRRKERDENLKAALRQADDWPEAFRKQRTLIGPELAFSRKNLAEVEADSRYPDEDQHDHDLGFWRGDVAGLQADLEMIAEAERIYAEEAEKAQAELDAVRKRMLGEVARRLRLRGESPSRGFLSELLECLSEDDPGRWLPW